jgi:hypothetical protein
MAHGWCGEVSVKNIVGKFGALGRVGKGIGLAAGLYALLLGVYPKPFNLLLVTGLLLVVAEALELYRAELKTIVKPVILGSSMGLIILYSFMVNDVLSSTIFMNQSSIIVSLVIGILLAVFTALFKLFE